MKLRARVRRSRFEKETWRFFSSASRQRKNESEKSWKTSKDSTWNCVQPFYSLPLLSKSTRSHTHCESWCTKKRELLFTERKRSQNRDNAEVVEKSAGKTVKSERDFVVTFLLAPLENIFREKKTRKEAQVAKLLWAKKQVSPSRLFFFCGPKLQFLLSKASQGVVWKPFLRGKNGRKVRNQQ